MYRILCFGANPQKISNNIYLQKISHLKVPSFFLQLIHSCVVDTAIVFPHRKGPPYKRALKTLMAEYMQKFIQDSIGN